jgi:TRAP-type C4-dicarboxylate transport system substrate-binding protein
LKPETKFTLKLAIHMEPGRPTWLAYERWAKKVEEASNGSIAIDISYSGIIGIEEWHNLRSRESDIARVFTMDMAPFPLHTVPALPFLMPPGEEKLAILNSLYDKHLHSEWKEVKVLWLGLMSPYNLHTTEKPVGKLEDFRGLKLQASGLVAELVKVWGGIPITLIAPGQPVSRQDIANVYYSALRNGTIDGTVSSFEVIKDFKLYEVTKYHTCLNAIRDVNATIMNLEAWNSLPQDIQRIFEKLNPWAQKELYIAQKDESEEAQAILKQQGNVMLELSPEERSRWVKATETLVEEKINILESQGIRARAIAQELSQFTKRTAKNNRERK